MNFLGSESLRFGSGMFLGLAISRFRQWTPTEIASGCFDLLVMVALFIAADKRAQ